MSVAAKGFGDVDSSGKNYTGDLINPDTNYTKERVNPGIGYTLGFFD